MAIADRISASGVGAQTALAITGNVVTGLVATGSTQATALALTATVNAVATAAASTGVILQNNLQPGDLVEVYNGGANALLVYPPVGGVINNTAANTGFSVATLKSATFRCTAGGATAPTFFVNLGA